MGPPSWLPSSTLMPSGVTATEPSSTRARAHMHTHTTTRMHLRAGGPSIVMPSGTLTSSEVTEVPNGGAPAVAVPITSVHAPPGTFAPNALVFNPPRCRVLLSGADVQALVHMLEDGGQLQVEVARCGD